MAMPATLEISTEELHEFGMFPRLKREPLTSSQILIWADAHKSRTDSWPTQYSGPVLDAPGETWCSLDVALRNGGRGLPGGDSLARLLRREGRIGERRGRQ